VQEQTFEYLVWGQLSARRAYQTKGILRPKREHHAVSPVFGELREDPAQTVNAGDFMARCHAAYHLR
jgi:hypothetical protein